MIIFTDKVIEDITRDIASHDPERGGALMGAPHTNIISEFIYDNEGETTGVSYNPSKDLGLRVVEREKIQGLVYKGIIHSHPKDYNELSGQDIVTFEKHLRLNTHVPYFVVPIVTLESEIAGNNQLELSEDRALNLFVAERKKNYKGIHIHKKPISICYIERDINIFLSKIGLDDIEIEDAYIDLNGMIHIQKTMKYKKMVLVIIFPINYPFSPPLVFQGRNNEASIVDMKTVKIDWDVLSGSKDQLSCSFMESDINIKGKS